MAADAGVTIQFGQVSKSFHNLKFVVSPPIALSLLRLHVHLIGVDMINGISVLVIVEDPTQIIVILPHTVLE